MLGFNSAVYFSFTWDWMLVLRGNQCLSGKIHDVDNMNDYVNNMNDVEIQWKLEMKTYFLAHF